MKWRPCGSNDLLGPPIVESEWSSSRSYRLFATSVIVCGGRRAITTAAWKAVTAIKRPQKLWDLRRGWRYLPSDGSNPPRWVQVIVFAAGCARSVHPPPRTLKVHRIYAGVTIPRTLIPYARKSQFEGNHLWDTSRYFSPEYYCYFLIGLL